MLLNNDATRWLIIIGAALAMLAVILGAFGAHGLKKSLSNDMMAVYQTAVEYHFGHALGIILIGLIVQQFPHSQLVLWAGIALIIGILLFSGSLYVLSITGVKKLGIITPIGGLAFIIGWLLLIIGMLKQ